MDSMKELYDSIIVPMIKQDGQPVPSYETFQRILERHRITDTQAAFELYRVVHNNMGAYSALEEAHPEPMQPTLDNVLQVLRTSEYFTRLEITRNSTENKTTFTVDGIAHQWSEADRAAALRYIQNTHGIFDPRLFDTAWKEYIAEREQKPPKTGTFTERFHTAARAKDYEARIDTAGERPPVETGFAVLDSVLDGGIYPGLNILTSESSMGKSAFCHQIADHAADNGRDVLYFLLEMDVYEMISRSISRRTFELATDRITGGEPMLANDMDEIKPLSSTSRTVSEKSRIERAGEEQRKIIEEARQDYFTQTADHIFFVTPQDMGKHFLDTDDVEALVAQYYADRKPAIPPLVIIDYCQLLQPGAEARTGDKISDTGRVGTVMYHMSKDYCLPLLLITSQPRSAYGQRDSMSGGKNSGELEYSADAVFRLQWQEESKSQATAAEQNKTDRKNRNKEIRKVQLYIGKARGCRPGTRVNFDFHGAFSRFIETGKEDDEG